MKNLKKLPRVFWLMLVLIVVTTLFDVLTTLGGRTQLELNPIFLFLGGGTVMLIFKLLCVSWLIYLLYRSHSSKKFADWHKFVLINVAVLLILIQILVGLNNINQSRNNPENVPGYETLVEKTVAAKQYFSFQLWAYAYPMLVSMLTYAFHFYFTKKNQIKGCRN